MSRLSWCYDNDIASPVLEVFQAQRRQIVDLDTVKFYGSSLEDCFQVFNVVFQVLSLMKFVFWGCVITE